MSNLVTSEEHYLVSFFRRWSVLRLILSIPEYMHALAQPPEHGEDFDDITDDYQRLILPGAFIFIRTNCPVSSTTLILLVCLTVKGLTHWQHPAFFAYFPTACTFEGILGDLYANSTSNPGFNVRSNASCCPERQ